MESWLLDVLLTNTDDDECALTLMPSVTSATYHGVLAQLHSRNRQTVIPKLAKLYASMQLQTRNASNQTQQQQQSQPPLSQSQSQQQQQQQQQPGVKSRLASQKSKWAKTMTYKFLSAYDFSPSAVYMCRRLVGAIVDKVLNRTMGKSLFIFLFCSH